MSVCGCLYMCVMQVNVLSGSFQKHHYDFKHQSAGIVAIKKNKVEEKNEILFYFFSHLFFLC